MPIYTVHVPGGVADAAVGADRTAFVREGFNAWAFWFGPLFLLRHRAWLAAGLWAVVVFGGAWLAARAHIPASAQAILLILVELFVGLEGNMLRGLALERRGFAVAGVVAGAGREDSERAFFRRQGLGQPVIAPTPVSTSPSRPMRTSAEPDRVIGLFPSRDD